MGALWVAHTTPCTALMHVEATQLACLPEGPLGPTDSTLPCPTLPSHLSTARSVQMGGGTLHGLCTTTMGYKKRMYNRHYMSTPPCVHYG